MAEATLTKPAMPMTLTEPPMAKTEMLIRRPVEEVFRAFIDPEITTRFWFTKSSGTLESGKRVRWDWEMYGIHSDVEVKAIEDNRRILIEWSSSVGRTPVEWVFTPRSDGTTFVTITNHGFHGNANEVVKQAIESAQGFTFVLSGLKALLEHGVELNLVADKCPDDCVKRRRTYRRLGRSRHRSDEFWNQRNMRPHVYGHSAGSLHRP
jgi:uncharacterized protein YndB with AHSA1/START domain